MNLIEKSLSAFITETFNAETMDIVSEACELLNDFYFNEAGTELPKIALFVYQNYKTLSEVSMKVDEASETHDLDWDFNFDCLDPWVMIGSTHYCSEDRKGYSVSDTIKSLIDIGLGVQWLVNEKVAFYQGIIMEKERAAK